MKNYADQVKCYPSKLKAENSIILHIIRKSNTTIVNFYYKILKSTRIIVQSEWYDILLKIKLWFYLEGCVLLFFWVNKEKFCILALNAYNKQLLDEVEHDIMNYQIRDLCYLPKPKAEADNTDTRFW